ncbi:hypothetical protein HAV38_19110 [Glaciimonas immobilis]|nr:hypothetical protein HAV38_19110 [Glaciimonas immobilis]
MEAGRDLGVGDGNASGVSWAAIFAGAVAAAALSLVLFILGTGLGLSSVSPWSYNAAPLGKATIIWLAFTQLAAAGIGGYMAGRLRIKWASVHSTEVYFRDTAHGLLTWAVATLLTAAFLTSAVSAITSGAVQVGGAAVAAVGATAGASANGANYFSDMLLRQTSSASSDGINTAAVPNEAGGNTTGALATGAGPSGSMASNSAIRPGENTALRAEMVRILANATRTGTLPADDKAYLSQQVSQTTGLPRDAANKRVDDIFARMTKAKTDAEVAAKDTADKARKVAAQSALWIFVALLLGAFFASVMATLGGKQRDRVWG